MMTVEDVMQREAVTLYHACRNSQGTVLVVDGYCCDTINRYT